MPSVFKRFVLAALVPSFGLWAQEPGPQEEDAWFSDLFESEFEESLAEEPAPETEAFDAAAMEAELAALQELRAWSVDSSAEAGFGWRQNALLEEDNEVDSAFAQAAADVFAFKPGFGGRPELLALLYAEYRYYDDVPGLSSENLLLAQASAKRRVGSDWKAGVFFEAVRSVQAYDASVEEFVTDATTVRFWKPELGLSLERDFEGLGSFSLKPAYAWGRYDLSSEDFDETSLELGFGRRVGQYSKVQLSVVLYRENYDARESRLSQGTLQDAPLLELEGQRIRGEWIYQPDGGPFQRLRSRVEYEREDDRVGDYYQRGYWQARQSADFEWGAWKLELALAYGDLGYDRRRASLAGEETRSERNWRWEAELRRRFSERAHAYLKMEGSEKNSNTPGYSYDSASVLMGMSFSGFLGN